MAKTTKKPGRPPKHGEIAENRVNLAIVSALNDALEDYIASCRPMPSKSEVVRTAIEDFLKREGYWPPRKAEA